MKMRRLSAGVLAWSSLVLTGHGAHAQDPVSGNVELLHRNIEIFSGVLGEAIGLDERAGLFSANTGEIDSIYLQGQGVLLQIRTPLAARRLRLNLDALNTSIQNLEVRRNPFELLTRPQVAPTTEAMALSLRRDAVGEQYRDLQQQIRDNGFISEIRSAIRQGGQFARALQNLDSVTDSEYLQIESRLGGYQSQLNEHVAELRGLEQEVQRQAEESQQDRFLQLQQSLEQLIASVSPLRDDAVDAVAELRQRHEEARANYASRWSSEVTAFEGDLFSALCGYGTTLWELPENESLILVLTDLGHETGDRERRDRIHIVKKGDLARCHAGDIDAPVLQRISISYDY
ncbi:MAG: hypothetical protein WDZ76_00295 [Pseudohongiellaceae bacterium]